MTINSRQYRRQTGLSRRAALWMALALGLGVGVYFFGFAPTGGTGTPGLLAPASGTVMDPDAAGAQLTLEWSHGFKALDNLRPRRASHFAICIYDEAAGEECAPPNALSGSQAPTLTWLEPLSSFSNTQGPGPSRSSTAPALEREILDALNPAMDRPYRYAFPVPDTIPDTLKGRDVAWTVGACNGTAHADCNYAAPYEITFGSVNLIPGRLRESSFGGYQITVAARNIGSLDSGAIDTQVWIWEVLWDESLNGPRKDYTSSSLPQPVQIVTTFGSVLDASTVSDPGIVMAIVKAGGFNSNTIISTTNVPAHPTDETFLPSIPFVIPAGERPTAFAVSWQLDVNDAVFETDESDNRRADVTDPVY